MRFEVVLICDHKWRDLPGLAWLKVLLKRARPDWRVTVISKSFLGPYTRAFTPSVLVLPTSNGAWLRTAQNFRDRGTLTAILPTEGRPTYGRLVEWCVRSHDGCQADGVLLWSDTMKEVFDRVSRPNALRAAVVGPTRFDFYRPPLRRLLPDRAQFAERISAPADRPVVGWPTTFPHAKFHGGDEAWQIADWRRMNLEAAGMTEDVMRRMIRGEFEGREASLDALECSARALPEVTFCLKPHPFEDVEYPERRIAQWRADGLDNVRLVRGMYIWDLLSACSVHVHRTCTTGTEAWLLGIPTVELGFVPSHASLLEDGAATTGAAKDAEAAEDVAESPDELMDKLRRYLAGGEVPPDLVARRKAYAARWFGKVDGHATERAVERLIEWAAGCEPVRTPFWRREGLRSRVGIALKRAIGMPFEKSLRHPGRRAYAETDTAGHWDRAVSQRDVRAWTRRLEVVR
jgi:surface carbohydrate biosynthesis protein